MGLNADTEGQLDDELSPFTCINSEPLEVSLDDRPPSLIRDLGWTTLIVLLSAVTMRWWVVALVTSTILGLIVLSVRATRRISAYADTDIDRWAFPHWIQHRERAAELGAAGRRSPSLLRRSGARG